MLRAALEHNLHNGAAAGQALVLRLATTATSARRRAATGTSPRSAPRRIGAEDPALDAELIILAADGYRSLGLRGVRLLLNSLGDKECRPVYRAALQDVPARARPRRGHPRAGSRSTRCGCSTTSAPEVQTQLAGAPLVARPPVRGVQGLPRGGPRAADAPRAWRTRTTRGWCAASTTTPAPPSSSCTTASARSPRSAAAAATTACREMIGGPPLPGVGWALGVDRTVLALEAEGLLGDERAAPRPGVRRAAGRGGPPRGCSLLVTELRRAGVAADFAFGGKGLKGAMKGANRSGARYALIARRARPRRGRRAAQGPGQRRADRRAARPRSSRH